MLLFIKVFKLLNEYLQAIHFSIAKGKYALVLVFET